jgi:lysophospholipase L1-like esterase
VPELSPSLRTARIFTPSTLSDEKGEPKADAPPDLHVGEAELKSESRSLPGMATPDSAEANSARGPIGGQEAPLDLPAIAAEAPPIDLLDPTGKSLDGFFRSLTRTQQKKDGAITRIAHFGDSIVVSDYISGTLRRKLQETFGDAGHGYMLIANAWPAYFHNDVFRFATSGFRVSRIVGPLTDDNMYGLGGVTFRSSRGVIAQFGTAEKGDYGARVSHFELSYLASPGGGMFELWVDGKPHSVVDTNAPSKEARRAVVEVTDGPHRFEMRTKTGEVRTFGVVLERSGPGVVLDALGVQGARIRFLDKQDDEHFKSELKWRQPALVIYQFGANESGDGYAYPMDQYFDTMKAVIAQGQAALPDSSCLIIGAMDRARHMDGVTSSMKIIQLIIKEQERAARELGCAYFDTYNAMGGWGSMPAWVKRGLGQADMTHPTGVGAIRIGNWVYGALMKRYDQYLAENAGRP